MVFVYSGRCFIHKTITNAQKIIFYSTSIFLFLLSFSVLNAQTKSLKVGLAGGAPFVVKDSSQSPSGIAVEIWEDVAAESNLSYKYIDFDSVKGALAALEQGEIDLVVGPISITSERVSHMRFSQPYYQSSMAIASRLGKPDLWDRIKPFFSFKLVIAIAIFLFILSLVGALLWLAERKESPDQFPPTFASGVANGMWLAIVTMSTTGYGDKAPVTLWGRIIAGVWMVVSIIFATSMVAGIASTLTLSGLGDSTINTIEQLSGKSAAAVLGSPAEQFLKDHFVKEYPYPTLEEAMKALGDKKVDAVIFDRPQLLFYKQSHPNEKIYIAKAEYYKQGYGFAFPLNSKLPHQVNIKMLELAEEGRNSTTTKSWIGKDE